MGVGWPRAPLKELLERSDDWVEVQPDKLYRQVTVRLWGQGVVERSVTTGNEISTRRRLSVRAGQFILSKIDARNGAYGLVPESLDGAVVSNDFPVFNVRGDRLLPSYLGWMSRTPDFVDMCRAASEGTTNRVRLREDRFLALTIPLPEVEEQQRLVERIEEFSDRIEDARRLRRQAGREAEALMDSCGRNAFAEAGKVSQMTTLDATTRIVGGGSLPDTTALPGIAQDILLLKVSDMNLPGNEQLIRSSAIGLSGDSPLSHRLRILPKNSVVFPKRGGAIATNKKRLLAKPAVLDPNLMGVTVRDEHQLDCRYLLKWLDTIDLASLQGGTSVPQINKGDLAPLALPIPPLAQQRRMVAYLDDLKARVDALKRLQAETAAELDALLPSVLQRAFKGEL